MTKEISFVLHFEKLPSEIFFEQLHASIKLRRTEKKTKKI